MPDLLEPVTVVHQKPRLYVVDDDFFQREFLKAILTPRGYHITTFEYGEQFLDAVFKNSPDLVLLDIMLPGASGYDICCTIKENRDSPGYIPVLLVSTLSETADRIRGNEAGADDFISIPFVEDELFTRVQSLLRSKRCYDQLVVQQKLLQERHKQLYELQKLKEDLGELLVHDLKNPLAVISGNVELLELKKRGELDDESRKSLAEIRDGCGRLLKMIDCLLDINRLEEGKSALNRLPVDTEPFLEKIVSHYEPLAELKKVKFTFRAVMNVKLSIEFEFGLSSAILAFLSHHFLFNEVYQLKEC